MKAIVLNNYGPSESLEYKEVPQSAISDEQVLVKISAAAVNALDLGKAAGAFKGQSELKFPWIPGIDFSGTIEAVGLKIKGFKPGDDVFGASLNGGAFAEYIAISPEFVALKPKTLNHIEAASVPVSAETAWQILFQHGEIIKGKTVLIHGAAGAVGSYLVQLAHHAGAKVIVTASAGDKAYLNLLGADEFIDQMNPFEKVVNDVDMVVDLIGKDVQQRSYQIIKKGGYLIATNQPPDNDVAVKYNINAVFFQLKPSGIGLSRLAALIDSGKLQINLSAVYPLNGAVTAWNDLLHKPALKPKKKHGRIVLKIS